MRLNVLKPWLVGLGTLLIAGLLFLLLKKKPSLLQAMSPDQRSVIQDSEYWRYDKLIYAQSAHETAYRNNYQEPFTSNLFIKQNNAFGMGVPSKRKFLGSKGPIVAEGQYMAKYPDVRTSWLDLLEWFRYNKFPTDLNSTQEYVAWLKKFGYFTAPEQDYLRGVNYWIKKLNLGS